MNYNLNQTDIFSTIINIRGGDNTEVDHLCKETEKFLNIIIKNYNIPEGCKKEDIIHKIQQRIIDNLHTYNPRAGTYTAWVSDILNNYITYLHINIDDKQTGNFINWKWELAYNESHNRQIASISNLNPFNSVYIKELRKKFLNILSEIDEGLQKKTLLLCFQNPLRTKYWSSVLNIDEDAYSNCYVKAVKNLKKIIFEKKENKDFAAIIDLVTRKLTISILISAEELGLLNDEQMKKAINNSFIFGESREAAEEMSLTEEEYIRLLFKSLIELAEKIAIEEEKKEHEKKKEDEEDENSETMIAERYRMDIDKQIVYYRQKILHYSLKHNTPRESFFMDADFSDYKKLLDFIYLLFTAQAQPPSIIELLTFTINNKASDLHLSAGLSPMLRIDGDIRRINIPPLEKKIVHKLLYNLMNDEQRKYYEENLEMDFSYELPEGSRFRVNVFNQYRGYAAAFRAIPSRIMSLKDIGMPEVLKSIADSPNGLILVTGSTGSGKSTTLSAMIEYKNKNNYSNIITIEDPIEYLHKSKKCLINQREVHRSTHSFSKALRSALREDPDIILVGEMRDLETIRLALTAAETGHLVFATLHTNTAPKAIDRIIDVFPANEKNMALFMLSESLRAVISQTLFKRIGGGRIAAFEIMIANAAIRNLIREEKIPQMYTVMQMAQSEGMQTLDKHLQKLIEQNLIAPEDAYSQVRNRK